MIKVLGPIVLFICMLSAMFFVYKWYRLYTSYKGISIKEYRPKYIKQEESPFTKEITGRLNVFIVLMYLFMVTGVLCAIIFDILS
ncbi:hypothetical protein [Formosa sp. S-31]|uniref:hypothetical protein n=1 Tax=Formosa sp. S-31 TaxID=2790949 RepID=UPI003EB880D1